MKDTRYLVFEGVEGVGKSTQCRKLVSYLTDKGYSVLESKEPGTTNSPLTMSLRQIMLDKKYDEELTRQGRELISQAIRSIHLEKVIKPVIGKYDFIIQDRGILSGIAYGVCCGNSLQDIESLLKYIDVDYGLYHSTIYLKGNVKKSLDIAVSSKNEFETGDAIESRGYEFMEKVSDAMDRYSKLFNNVEVVDVTDMAIEETHQEIKRRLGI